MKSSQAVSGDPGSRPGEDDLESVVAAHAEPQLERKEFVTGRQSGNTYVRVHRDMSGLRRLGAGHLEATAEALRPRTGFGRALSNLKGVLVGQPLATAQLAHERLSKVK